ncbi:AraC family transcriptional regulator [Novosphingobium sp.]|uniref:AraC family transcriptional regulator n=1 Tax=Novosphingobium sp. TaxID=1874826 RepID=UPI0035B19468
MRQIPTIRAAALTGFGALARSYGLDPKALLRSAGLPGDAEADPDRRLPTRAVNCLFETAAEHAGADDFGLRLAELRGFSNLGPVTLLARDEPDIRSALAIFISYLPLHNEALSIALSEHDGLAILSCELAGEGVKVQAADVAVAMLHRILRQLLGTDWHALGIYLERQRPVRLGAFERAFSGRVHFGQDFSGVAFDSGDLERPNLLAQAALRPYTAQLRATLPGFADLPLAERIRRLLRAMLASGRCTAPLAAERLGMSRRTMERRLAAEGVSFHALLDEVRGEVARGQLSGSSRSNAEIAGLLGFASSAAFTAWFSGRFGLAPQAWRKQAGSSRQSD